MFQFIRRVSGSLLPRPDRPWRDDATSHAPTIGRKRRYSVTERDNGDSVSSKRTKRDLVKPHAECDSASSECESTKNDAVSPVDTQGVKEVTKGVKEVDLEDRDKVEEAPSIQPEGVPLPDSPSGSPDSEGPASDSPEQTDSDAAEESKDLERADDRDSLASSAPEDNARETAAPEPIAAKNDAEASIDGAALSPEVTTATVESGLHDTPGTLEVKA